MMNQYETFMRHVYTTGDNKTDRTGTGTRSVFGYQMRFDLSKGFPMVTTKKLHRKGVKSIKVDILMLSYLHHVTSPTHRIPQRPVSRHLAR